LNPEVEFSLVGMPPNGFHEAITQKEFLKIVREQQNSKLRKGRVHDFIGRDLDELQVCRSLPQEDIRMAVARTYLEEHIHLLKTHVTGKVAKLVFDLDELGSADWEDRKGDKVVAEELPRKV
jgi:hypothetical protein